MSFSQRSKHVFEQEQPSRLEHAMLVAALAARRAGARGPEPDAVPANGIASVEEDPLVELLVAGPSWRKAVSAQHGCFSRAEVRRRVNDR